MADRLVNALGPLDGGRVRGGCECCDAYQTVQLVSPGVWDVTVHHDDWCPVLLTAERIRREE
jgi:hypothetical protein